MTEHVKVYGVKPRIQYTADGILTTYEFPFAVFKASDIDVYLGATKQATNTYTVTGVGNSNGGAVVFNTAPATQTIITIVRNLSIERTSDFQEGSTLRAKVLNDELDYQIACQQQIAENLNRSLVLPPYAVGTDVDLTLPTPSAGKSIIWNADGTNLENSTIEVNALESTLRGYKETAQTAATTASTKADIATSAAETASAKATEAVTTVNAKANKDMDNLTTTGKSALVLLSLPDYSAGISLSAEDSPYTAPSAGLCIIASNQQNATRGMDVSINNVLVYRAGSGNLNTQSDTASFELSKDDVITFNSLRGIDADISAFYPFKGV